MTLPVLSPFSHLSLKQDSISVPLFYPVDFYTLVRV